MGTKKISLDESVYTRLRAAKRLGESFSDVVQRLLADAEPSLSIFRGFIGKEGAEELAEVVSRMREEDIEIQRRRLASDK